MDAILIIVVIGIIIGVIKKEHKDAYCFGQAYSEGKQYWTDSEGQSRLFKTGKKVYIDYNKEGHVIATDSKMNKINLTEQKLIQYAEMMKNVPHYVQKYGNDYHSRDKVKGQRYCEWLGDHWRFYVAVSYHYCHLYLDAETGEAVMPTASQLFIEKVCKEEGAPYNTINDLNLLIDHYNKTPENQRKKHTLPYYEDLFERDRKKIKEYCITGRVKFGNGIVKNVLKED